MRRPRAGSFGSTLWATATNLAIVGVTVIASVLVARSLGPQGRGEFATLMAVFTISMVLGELGQSASVTYHVATDASRATYIVAAGRRIMLVASTVTCALVLVTVLIALRGDPEHAAAYGIALVGCLANAFGAPYLYAVQAIDLAAWNRVRLVQPVTYVALVTLGFAVDRLTLSSLALALVVSTAAALGSAWIVARRLRLTGGHPEDGEVRRMTRYGALASSAGVPISLGQNMDKVLLTGASTSAFVGQYSVASTVAGLSQPFASAVASVVFPQVARADDEAERRRLGRTALFRSISLSMPLTIAIALVGGWALPWVFGSDFEPAVALLWALAPGQFVRANNIVMTSLLRGIGRPGAAAKSQITAALGFLAGLLPAVLLLGEVGVGVALLAGEAFGFMVAWRAWRTDSAPPASEPLD